MPPTGARLDGPTAEIFRGLALADDRRRLLTLSAMWGTRLSTAWIKYKLAMETPDGVAIESWFLPAYGKTPDSMMLSRTSAIEQATVVSE